MRHVHLTLSLFLRKEQKFYLMYHIATLELFSSISYLWIIPYVLLILLYKLPTIIFIFIVFIDYYWCLPHKLFQLWSFTPNGLALWFPLHISKPSHIFYSVKLQIILSSYACYSFFFLRNISTKISYLIFITMQLNILIFTWAFFFLVGCILNCKKLAHSNDEKWSLVPNNYRNPNKH